MLYFAGQPCEQTCGALAASLHRHAFGAVRVAGDGDAVAHMSEYQAQAKPLAQLDRYFKRPAPSSLSLTPQTSVPRIRLLLAVASPTIATAMVARHRAAASFRRFLGSYTDVAAPHRERVDGKWGRRPMAAT
jgi:hypothetical protein